MSRRTMPPARVSERGLSTLSDTRMDNPLNPKHPRRASGPVPRRRRKGRHVAADPSPTPPGALYDVQFDTDGLAHLRPFVSKMLHCPASCFILSVKAPGCRFPVCITRKDSLCVLALLVQDAEHERAVSDFFHSQGLDHRFGLQKPLPSLRNRRTIGGRLPLCEEFITALVGRLLRCAYGVSCTAGLTFGCYAGD
jgi:hypothetical protein